jgi:hypothetical protein
MTKTRRILIAATLVAATSLCAARSHAGLFKLDFSTIQNLSQNVALSDWDTFSDWSFADFPDGIATWKLTDFSADKNTNVTLTILDNAPLAALLGAPAIGMAGNNPDAQGLDVAYDGINVPAAGREHQSGRLSLVCARGGRLGRHYVVTPFCRRSPSRCGCCPAATQSRSLKEFQIAPENNPSIPH